LVREHAVTTSQKAPSTFSIDVEHGRKFSLLDLVGIAHVIEDSLGLSANVFMRRSLEPQMFVTIKPDITEIF